ncbi:DUF6044 family protein [Bacillus sp. EB01]|uniref:DUF6044 family protein n=1 Tax=Bacillus sp. EB01 TaxID=1347086 RepID=UPI0005C442E1
MIRGAILKKEKVHLWVAGILLALYLSPLFVLGEDAHMRIHDNLDSNISWYKVLRESGELFGATDAVIPQIINGLPRNTYGTEFSGIQWLHHLFPSMLAYALSQAITRIVAFIGMYLLLSRHFIKERNAFPISVWVALAFALTPFWPSGMLSTLGMPLALWAFLNIRDGRHSWKEWLTLFLLPLYSSFVLGFFFFLAAMGLLWLRDVLVKKSWNWTFFASIAFMTIMYLLVEYRLVLSLVLPEEPTSRNEFDYTDNTFWQTIMLIGKNYFFGHNHVLTLHTYVIVPLSFLVLIWIAARKTHGVNEKRFTYLFVLNIVLSIWYSFWFYKGWHPIKEEISLLKTFNFSRFHFLRPLIIYMMFAVGAYVLWQKGGVWKKAAGVALALQIAVVFYNNGENEYGHRPSFKQFYAVDQFEDIRDFIGKSQESYRVASIGIHPAIAQYNGFYTLDTYNNFYSLEYKHRFREIISKELEKNAIIEDYFDTWGGRCYIFVAELGKHYEFKKTTKKEIENLELNTKVFKELGGEYIFSAVPVKNPEENGMKLEKVFDNNESAWRIYLYHVTEGVVPGE